MKIEELNMEDFLNEFSLFDVMYGGSDSDEDITCSSCARGRDSYSALMPRLPNYKIVHRKKIEFKTNLGVPETEVKQRTLGRGRAKRRQGVPQTVATVGGADSTSDSDERLQRRIGVRTELRKPRLKLPILRCESDFPQLKPNCEQNVSAATAGAKFQQPQPAVIGIHGDNFAKQENVDPENFNDMAKFLMDSWQDEITDGQFEDAALRFDCENDKSEGNLNEKNEENLKETNSCHSSNNIISDSSVGRKTNDYFRKFEAEVDDIKLDDFENMSVSDAQVKVSNEISDLNSPNQVKSTVTNSGIWYSSDDVYESQNLYDLQWNTDTSDNTDVSQRTDSLLPCDKSDSDNECSELRKTFDFTIPGQESFLPRDDLSNNASSAKDELSNNVNIDVHISSPETHSTLSSSKTDSMGEALCQSYTTSEKDESQPNVKWENIGRREKKRIRDAERAKKFYENRNKSPDTITGKKSKNNSKKGVKIIQSAQSLESDSEWRINGNSVIQLNGLPIDCDVSILQDLVASYGTVKDFEKKTKYSSSSVRFRLDNADACEMVVSCLDDTDIFPDAASKISCVTVQ